MTYIFLIIFSFISLFSSEVEIQDILKKIENRKKNNCFLAETILKFYHENKKKIMQAQL